MGISGFFRIKRSFPNAAQLCSPFWLFQHFGSSSRIWSGALVKTYSVPFLFFGFWWLVGFPPDYIYLVLRCWSLISLHAMLASVVSFIFVHEAIMCMESKALLKSTQVIYSGMLYLVNRSISVLVVWWYVVLYSFPKTKIKFSQYTSLLLLLLCIKT